MALADMQRSLARLYTDADARARFAADPQAAVLELGLSAGDAEALTRLPTAQVALFARSLIAKRGHEAAKLLPLTRRVLGADFAVHFRHYAEARPIPNAPRPHHADALAFAAFLRRQNLSEPPWAADALRYDALCLRAAQPGMRLLTARFQYAAMDFIKGGTIPIPRRPTLGLWLHWRGRLCHWLVRC